jgi:hypothetical protein
MLIGENYREKINLYTLYLYKGILNRLRYVDVELSYFHVDNKAQS